MNEKIGLAVIYGSAREGRVCDKVGTWVSAELARHGDFARDLIDPLTLSLGARPEHNAAFDVTALKERIGKADAFIVVTPEYNHSYPAPLKLLIDSVYDEWKAKPVAFVSYGGSGGGLRAVEQLRQVFAGLHAVSIKNTVSFVKPWQQLGADGNLRAPDAVRQAMTLMLAQLHWWASALRQARGATPYPYEKTA